MVIYLRFMLAEEDDETFMDAQSNTVQAVSKTGRWARLVLANTI
jgi:hypothetical protein